MTWVIYKNKRSIRPPSHAPVISVEARERRHIQLHDILPLCERQMQRKMTLPILSLWLKTLTPSRLFPSHPFYQTVTLTSPPSRPTFPPSSRRDSLLCHGGGIVQKGGKGSSLICPQRRHLCLPQFSTTATTTIFGGGTQKTRLMSPRDPPRSLFRIYLTRLYTGRP